MSVIIPVRDRRELLERTLDALDLQEFDDFEVVVADDGSTDGSGEAAAARTIAGRPVRVVQGGGRGAVEARTTAVAAARGDVLAFTDSDCEPTPKWLSVAVAAIDAGADLVNGYTGPTGPVKPLERSLWSGEEGLYPSCNIIVRRRAYDDAEGFESRSSGRDYHGADTLFAWKIRRVGTVVYEPEAEVRHAVLPFDRRDSLQRAWQVSAFPQLVKEVPELRATRLIRHGFSLGERSRFPLYASVLALLTGRWRLALAFSLWWVFHTFQGLRRFQGSRAERLRALPDELLLDLVQSAGLVVGSARARNVVL